MSDGDAARTLAGRATAQASLGDPGGIAELLRALREAGAGDAARTLVDRAANADAKTTSVRSAPRPPTTSATGSVSAMGIRMVPG